MASVANRSARRAPLRAWNGGLIPARCGQAADSTPVSVSSRAAPRTAAMPDTVAYPSGTSRQVDGTPATLNRFSTIRTRSSSPASWTSAATTTYGPSCGSRSPSAVSHRSRAS